MLLGANLLVDYPPAFEYEYEYEEYSEDRPRGSEQHLLCGGIVASTFALAWYWDASTERESARQRAFRRFVLACICAMSIACAASLHYKTLYRESRRRKRRRVGRRLKESSLSFAPWRIVIIEKGGIDIVSSNVKKDVAGSFSALSASELALHAQDVSSVISAAIKQAGVHHREIFYRHGSHPPPSDEAERKLRKLAARVGKAWKAILLGCLMRAWGAATTMKTTTTTLSCFS